MSEVAEVKPRKTATPGIGKGAFKLRECANNSFRAVAARGVDRDRLLQSDYWACVSDLLHAYDEIHVVAEDRSFYATYLVLEAGRGYVALVELSWHPLPALLVSAEGLPPNHSILYGGAEDLFIVKRESDGVILGKNFSDKQTALSFLLDHASLR